MTARQTQRSIDRPDLEAAYGRVLHDYLVGGGEGALGQAYEIGRSAMAEGRGLLEVVAMHHAALGEALRSARVLESLPRNLDRSREILAECLSPYEMAQRGFGDAIKALRRINETLECEIQRLAHDVHDEAGQLMVAARLAVSEAARGGTPAVRGRLAKVTSILDRAEQELRRISHELRPLILDDLGLVPAIRFLADGVSGRSRLQVHVESSMEGRPGHRIETAVYRIVQEALANAVRHARAQNVWIRLAREGELLACSVRDDGVGLGAAAAPARQGSPGLGLVGIRERLNAVGGTLRVQGGPGRGTELAIRVPWEG